MTVVSIQGEKQLLLVLSRLKSSTVRKAVRPAIEQSIRPWLKTAKTLVPTDQKLLRRSLGKKVKTYKGTVIGIIGPRVDKKFTGPSRAAYPPFKPGEGLRTEVPVNYAHMTEGGTKTGVTAVHWLERSFKKEHRGAAKIFGNTAFKKIRALAKAGKLK